MKPLDRLLQRWRIARAGRWIPPAARVLDIGCHDGALFRRLKSRVREGVGLDPELRTAVEGNGFRLLPGTFPDALDALPEDRVPFDAITLLAVLEHIPPGDQDAFARACARYLAPGGVLVITVPSPLVDRILDVLAALRLIDGMSMEQHWGFDPGETPRIFTGADLELVAAKRFQLGLNRLFVFRRRGAAAGEPGGPPVVLFDGVCNLCNGAVQFLLRRDRRGVLRFAALQSAAGRRLLDCHGLDAEHFDTMVLVEAGRAHVRSEAALRVVRHLAAAWPMLGVLRVVPRRWRDFLYDVIARRRYRWFGRRESCMLPTPEVRRRFLDADLPETAGRSGADADSAGSQG